MAVTPGDHLADTNILLRLTDPQAALHALVVQAVQRILAAGNLIHIAPQNLVEFWSVATRPQGVNGLGLTPAEAAVRVRSLKARFAFQGETPALYVEWERLAEIAAVSGKQVHDARIVAYMSIHAIPNILTLNAADFRRFESLAGIFVVEPQDI